MSENTIVILTGAGISKESGLATFRDSDGIWATVRIEDVATPQAFANDPAQVHAFYNVRRRALSEGGVIPNPAHLALAELEQRWPGEVLVVTQNIDDLHEKAGTKNLLHMHGELLKARCHSCAETHLWHDDLSVETPCPHCGVKGGMRPDVVWFGEMPLFMETIYRALARCRLFISIGTSGNVYPAAGFVAEVGQRKDVTTVELNLEPSEGASLFDDVRIGPASERVPEYVEEILGNL